jgi:hypothetical protein
MENVKSAEPLLENTGSAADATLSPPKSPIRSIATPTRTAVKVLAVALTRCVGAGFIESLVAHDHMQEKPAQVQSARHVFGRYDN